MKPDSDRDQTKRCEACGAEIVVPEGVHAEEHAGIVRDLLLKHYE
ncbi:hypothetical protein [Staphylospora marina]|nr:hypothetical protein [Staphylospora marina]